MPRNATHPEAPCGHCQFQLHIDNTANTSVDDHKVYQVTSRASVPLRVARVTSSIPVRHSAPPAAARRPTTARPDGLALIVGASPSGLAVVGLLAAAGGALCRTGMLLVTRATLKGTDARLVTWYTLWSSALVFAVLSLWSWNWQWPHGAYGWVAFLGIGFTTTAAILALYVSTERIGPFRTALFMNLEPLMTAALSAVVLGDRLTPIQALGGALMIAALCLFQARR